MSSWFDVHIVDHGSIFLLTPRSSKGERWVEDNLADEHTRFSGAVVLHHAHHDAADVCDRLFEDGLRFSLKLKGI